MRIFLFAFSALLVAEAAWCQPKIVVDAVPALPGVQASGTVAVGQRFAVDVLAVDLEPQAPLHAFQLSLTFSDTSLRIIEVVDASGLLQPTVTLEREWGASDAHFAITTLGPGGLTADSALVSVVLEAVAPGESSLQLVDVVLAEPYLPGEAIPFQTQGATIAIAQQVATEIPTLSQAALLALVIMLATAALLMLRKRASWISCLLCTLIAPAVAAQAFDSDVNMDGVVDILDASIVGSCVGADLSARPECIFADRNGDGEVSIEDLETISSTFRRSRGEIGIDALRVFLHPDDPALAEALLWSGTKLTFHGAAEETTVGALEYESLDGSGILYLDSAGRPSRFTSSSGDWVEFTWIDDDRIVVQAITPNGDLAQTTIDLAQSVASSSSEATAHSRRSGSLRVSSHPRAHSQPHFAAGETSTSGIVQVERCSEAVDDASVRILVVPLNPSSSVTPYSVTAHPTGPGTYSYTIPTSPSEAAETTGDVCNNVDLGLTVACAPAEAAPAVAAGCFRLAFPGAIAACLKAVGVWAATCAIHSPGPPGAPSTLSAGCELLEGLVTAVDRWTDGDLRVSASVSIPGEPFLPPLSKTIPTGGAAPNFHVELPADPKILSFTTTPFDPAPSQGYQVKVEVGCATPPRTVTLSISGTDGFSDSTTCNAHGSTTCTLFVPGAEAGVVDTLTAAVEGGETRTLTIVF